MAPNSETKSSEPLGAKASVSITLVAGPKVYKKNFTFLDLDSLRKNGLKDEIAELVASIENKESVNPVSKPRSEEEAGDSGFETENEANAMENVTHESDKLDTGRKKPLEKEGQPSSEQLGKIATDDAQEALNSWLKEPKTVATSDDDFNQVLRCLKDWIDVEQVKPSKPGEFKPDRDRKHEYLDRTMMLRSWLEELVVGCMEIVEAHRKQQPQIPEDYQATRMLVKKMADFETSYSNKWKKVCSYIVVVLSETIEWDSLRKVATLKDTTQFSDAITNLAEVQYPLDKSGHADRDGFDIWEILGKLIPTWDKGVIRSVTLGDGKIPGGSPSSKPKRTGRSPAPHQIQRVNRKRKASPPETAEDKGPRRSQRVKRAKL